MTQNSEFGIAIPNSELKNKKLKKKKKKKNFTTKKNNYCYYHQTQLI